MQRGPLTVAAAQPVCQANQVPANAEAHAECVRRSNSRLVVFPELSLTGYELGAEPVCEISEAVAPLIAACMETGSLALVGAPCADLIGRRFIAILLASAEGLQVVYKKSHLGAEEFHHFTAGPGAAVIEIDGWRVGLGICKDTGVRAHIHETAALGIDVYAAGMVHHPDELTEQDRRGVEIAHTADAPVIFSSFAGATGSGYTVTAGTSTIWSAQGEVLARAGMEVGEVVRATLV